MDTDTAPVPGQDAWEVFVEHLRRREGLEQLTLVGKGGMGRVYRAWDTGVERLVAVKVLDGSAATPESLHRFQQEGRTLGQLRHSAIVGVHKAGTSPEGVSYFAMDFVSGRDLGKIIQARRSASAPFTVAEAVQQLRPVADALDSIHRMRPQVIHRDVKPANILVPDEGTHWPSTVLTDFGISVSQDATRMTSAGFLIGTDRYMAPEQFRAVTDNGPTPGASVDDYAFALIVFEMLTLRSLRDLMGQDAWRFARRFPGLPAGALARPEQARAEAIGSVLARALADSPSRRFSTATDFLVALEGTASGMPGRTRTAPVPVQQRVSPQPPVPPQGQMSVQRTRKKRRGLATVSVLVLLSLVATVGYFAVREVRHPEWSGAEKSIAADFPGIVGQQQNSPGWLGMTCTPSDVGAGEVGRITCSGSGRHLVIADFGSVENRDLNGSAQETENLSSADCSIRTGVVNQASGTAWVVLPEQAGKDRYSLLLSASDARDDIGSIPVC